MSSVIKFAWILLLVFASNQMFAQQFGGNPSTLKWRQINTDTARIIYPEGLDSTANRVAAVIHELQRNHSATIGNKLRKINIVLQNQTTVTNGYVGLGPFRSEFYLFAPQNSFDLGALNWADMLATHEYRHVQQFNNFNEGLTKGFTFLFGQQGQALANAITIPDWFFEGDAVFNETALSKQGRGRLPEFFNGFQSLQREGKDYSYMKVRNGSLKDFVPNHYPLGYLLVAYGREKFGEEFWKKVTGDAARFKPLIYPFQGSVKKHSGVAYKQFAKDAFKFYNEKWQSAKNVKLEYLTAAEKNNVVAYNYPYLTGDGGIVVLKRSYRQIPAIYKIGAAGNQTKLVVRDIANDDYFSYKNGNIVFATYKPDKRWGYREFSNITLIDEATGSSKTITKGKRFFSPDISNDGTKIVAVNMQTNQQSSIEVIDVEGKSMFHFNSSPGIVYTYPKFSADEKSVYSAVRNTNGEMALVKLEINSGKQIILLPFQNRIIGFPTVQSDTIFFSSSYKGKDEIWAFVENKNQTFRVASDATGFYQAVYQPKQNRLVTSNFTADGYRLVAIPTSSLLWQPIPSGENVLPDLYVQNALQQENNATLQTIPAKNFQTSKYRKAFNLFNFHSWRPDYSDPEFSYTLFGQNILNTFQTELSYAYNRNETSHKAGMNAIYGGWYVQPSIGASQTWNRNIVYNRDTSFYYNEVNANVGISLPLNFSGGKMYRFLSVGSSINTQQVKWLGLGKNLLRNQEFNYLQTRLSYTQQIQKAIQHIYPRFAQSIFLQHRTIINQYTANQLLSSGTFYFPGLHLNHSIVVSASYQARDTLGQYFFSNNFSFSRGYRAVDFPRMWKFGSNYHFPIGYPDWGFGNILYFKRLRLNAFYDYTVGKSLRTGNTRAFTTTGVELFFDTKWWNQQEVSFGVRYSRLLNRQFSGGTNPNQWELIIPIDLIN